MTVVDDLAARFSTPEGLKKYFGLLGGKRAKLSAELIGRATASGVARAYTLDHREYEGSTYYVKAVSTRGDLDEATLSELTRAATLLPLGTLRYEGMMAATLPDELGSTDDANDIHSLSRLGQGIVVYPVSIMSKRGDASHAFWLTTGDEWYVEPIDDKKLK